MAPRIRRVLVGLHHSVAPSMTLQYTSDREGRQVGVPPANGRDGGLGIIGGEDLCLLPPDQIITVHCNQAYYGTVSSRGEAPGVTAGQSVVGTGQIVLKRDAVGYSRGGTDGGEEDIEMMVTDMD